MTETWNLKHGTNEPLFETDRDSTENRLVMAEGGGEGWTGSLGMVNENYRI